MSSGLPHVLFVGAFPSQSQPVFGGMVTSCRALLSSTLPQRVRLELFDSTQISNPPPGLLVRAWLAAMRFMRFVWRIEATRPDVVLMFVAVGASIVEKGTMARYARLRGIPAIMFPRGVSVVDDCTSSASTLAWVRFFFGGAERLICQGERWRSFAIRELGFSADRVTIVRNWTATRQLLQIGRGRIPRRTESPRLLFVGWLEREKGVFELIEACSRLAKHHLFTLDFVGDGHAMVDMRAMVSSLALSEIVRFRGWCDERDVQGFLRDADIFVLPSWAEGLPNAVVEAMAAGLPVVATRVGAVPDIISDHVNGLLVAPKDVESLSAALAEVLGDEALRERLALAAHASATSEFGVESATDRILEQIDRVVEKDAL